MKNLQEKKPSNVIKQGSIVKLGNHYLACGDSQNPEILKKLIDVSGYNKINLVLIDPPYGVGYVESKHTLEGTNPKVNKLIQNDQLQTDEQYTVFTQNWMQPIIPYLADKNSFYIFNSDKMLFALKAGMDASKVRFTQLLIWIKNNAVMGRLHYLPQHELIVFGWHGTHQFYKSQDKSVLYYPKPEKSSLHPTMKPIGLLRRLILNSSLINSVVYDGFGGSGSTLLACEQTQRKCLMVELDPDYCQTIIKRFEDVTHLSVQHIS